MTNRSDRWPKAVSLFCGGGGCSLGFSEAGYEIVYATDADEDAVATYRRNFPRTVCEVHDICQVESADILRKTSLPPGGLDILLGGPPCQGFSSAGGKTAADPRNSLIGTYIRLLEGLRPKWFVMENVEGLLTNDGGRPIRDAVRAFLDAGYSVNVEKLYAQGYGLPQRRKRVLIVGNRLGHDYRFPAPCTRFDGAIFRRGEISFAGATSDLPYLGSSGQAKEYIHPPGNALQSWLRSREALLTEHDAPELSVSQLERLRVLRPGQTMKDMPADLQHESFRRRAFRRVMDGTPVERRGGAPAGLKRLHADEPSLTITGAATREFVHPIEDRYLTLRECARLQTFPDWFEFVGSTASRTQQIANAIPPLLAKLIGEQIASDYGFAMQYASPGFPRLRFRLTRSQGMSPALARTSTLLAELVDTGLSQLSLLETPTP